MDPEGEGGWAMRSAGCPRLFWAAVTGSLYAMQNSAEGATPDLYSAANVAWLAGEGTVVRLFGVGFIGRGNVRDLLEEAQALTDLTDIDYANHTMFIDHGVDLAWRGEQGFHVFKKRVIGEEIVNRLEGDLVNGEEGVGAPLTKIPDLGKREQTNGLSMLQYQEVIRPVVGAKSVGIAQGASGVDRQKIPPQHIAHPEPAGHFAGAHKGVFHIGTEKDKDHQDGGENPSDRQKVDCTGG